MDGNAIGDVERLSYAGPSPRRPRGAGRVLAWVVGTVVVGGLLISILLPSLCRARPEANRAKCASNLHQVGLAILLYSQDHGGLYPPSLAVLPAAEQISAEVFVCPSSNDEMATANDTAGVVAMLTAAETNAAGHQRCLSYVYVGRGLTDKTATPTTVVAYEPLDNHDGDGTNVLFGDGHVEWEDGRAWPKVAAAAGVPVVRSPATRP